MALQQVDDEYGRSERDACKQVALPAGFGGEEAECRAFVMRQYEVEEGGDRAGLTVGEQFAHGDLGDLVKQDDDGGDAQPGSEAGLGRGGKILETLLFCHMGL